MFLHALSSLVEIKNDFKIKSLQFETHFEINEISILVINLLLRDETE